MRMTLRNASLQLVGAVQRLVRGSNPGQLHLLGPGQVARVLPQRVPGPLQPLGPLLVPGPAGVVPHLAADLVQGVGGPGHQVERVSAAHRGRAPLGDHVRDPVRPVLGHVRDQPGPVGAESVEERAQGGLVPPGSSPHQPLRVVVHHDGQVPVAALVRDLVDPDPPQPLQRVPSRRGLIRDPGDDRPDRAPRDPQQLTHRGLRVTASQATVSSNAVMCPAPCRAHGTWATTTPCSGHDTRGASASSHTGSTPASACRHRRRP